MSEPPCTWGLRTQSGFSAGVFVAVWRSSGPRGCISILLYPSTEKPRMNPKHFHTPVSTRLRCPICHQPVYSRGGIHPQCAMRQSEPALHEPEELVGLVAGDEKVAVAVAVAVPASPVPKIKTVARPAATTSVAAAKARPATASVGAVKAAR